MTGKEFSDGVHSTSYVTHIILDMATKQTEVKDNADDKQTRDPPSWKEAFLHFAGHTTLHGFKFIFLEKMFPIRRLLWMTLFVTCAALMSVQIIERIVYYYSHPVTVNVHVNFNKTLAFPAFTLCNQNAFRASAAAENDLYEMIEYLHSHNTNLTLNDLDRDKVGRLTLDEMYRKAGHRKEDFIVSCEWGDKPCGAHNFTEVLTDHGLCYTFNLHQDSTLWVHSAGSKYGLKLTLNVEQYEYMPGPHNSAGVKMLLHDQKEFPNVGELGMAIPTGTYTFVGMQLSWIQNLPEPHGACRSEQSPYYQHYSPDACLSACMTEALAELCHCRHIYMPHINGSPPVCTVEQYATCYRENIHAIRDKVMNSCDCPVQCDFFIYDPSMSFASTSASAKDRLLHATSSQSLQASYLHARETTSRMDKVKLAHFIDLQKDTKTRLVKLHIVMNEIAENKIRAQRVAMETIYQQMEAVYKQKSYLLSWQAFHVEKSFMRGRDAMEERTLGCLMLGFQEFAYQVESRIHQMADPQGNIKMTPEVRTSLYLNVLNMIKGRIDLANRAFDNYTEIYNAYLNGDYIFNYTYESEPLEDNNYVTPRFLMREALFRNNYTLTYSGRVGTDIREVINSLEKYLELAEISYMNSTVDDPEVLHKTNVLFLYSGRRFYHSKSVFYAESIDYPLKALQTNITEFDRRWRKFEENFQWMTDRIDQLLTRLDVLERTILKHLQSNLKIAETYIHNKSVTKMDVATALTSEDTYNGVSELTNFFDELRSRSQEIYTGWSSLTSSANQIWEMVLLDENLHKYCVYKNLTTFLRNFSEVAMETEEAYTIKRNTYDFRFLLGNLDGLFLLSLENLMNDMKKYVEDSQMDEDFIRDNFLQLDVFYREKNYELIKQQKAYDVFALLCDIGGSMGLFVGASMLTIYEIVDMFIHHSLFTLIHGSNIVSWIKKKLRKKEDLSC